MKNQRDSESRELESGVQISDRSANKRIVEKPHKHSGSFSRPHHNNLPRKRTHLNKGENDGRDDIL